MNPTNAPARSPQIGPPVKRTNAEWTAFFAKNAKQLRSLVSRKANLQASD